MLRIKTAIESVLSICKIIKKLYHFKKAKTTLNN